MIRHAEQTIRIRRQIHANHIRLFIHDMIDKTRVLVRKSVVVLPPDVAGEQIIQRRDGPAPGKIANDFQPLGVLIEHRIDDVDERFVAIEEAVAAGEQIALQPPFAHMLAENLHHPAVGRNILIRFQNRARENFGSDF